MSDHVDEMLARRSELAPTENARLEEHLRACPRCRQTAEAYAQQSALLRALPLMAPPPALRAGVLAGIREQPKRRWGLRPLFALAPLAAAAVVVLAALTYLHRPPTSQHTALPQARPTSAPVATAPVAQGAAKQHKTVAKRPHQPRQSRQHSTRGYQAPTSGPSAPIQSPPVVAQYYPTPLPQVAVPRPTASLAAPIPSSRRPVPAAASRPTASPPAAVAAAPARGSTAPPVPPMTGGGSGGKQHPTPTRSPTAVARPTVIVVAPVVTPVPANPPPTPSGGTTAVGPVITAPSAPSPVPTPTP